MPSTPRQNLWTWLGRLTACLLVLALAITLWEPVTAWLQGEGRFELNALREWIREGGSYKTLPELVRGYLKAYDDYLQLARKQPALPAPERFGGELGGAWSKVIEKREEIQVHLKSLGDPLVKMYPGQLPLFPTVYRLQVNFAQELGLEPIIWDSEQPRQDGQYRTSELANLDPIPGQKRAWIVAQYRVRVFDYQQAHKQEESQRQLRFGGVLILALCLLLVWVYVAQGRERERQRRQMEAEQQLNEAERRRLEEELRAEEAERRHQEAERRNLELKSQMFASIGIMAGSYAHNIKNLLVRPNDLLSRCLEANGLSAQQHQMLHEVRQTLGTVTERLQQILKTVRRDPTQSIHSRFDLNQLVIETQRTWVDLAREKWKVELKVELAPLPLWLEGDVSHLQQALENLLFNARDAVWEMRHQLRDQARRWNGPQDSSPALSTSITDRKQAILAAAAWRGEVILRTRLEDDGVVLEVRDNGIGMTEEVRRRCTETHFSTKRNNAIFEGFSAGMGLGLSFVVAILEHHRAVLTIESEPQRGTTFRIRFPRTEGETAQKVEKTSGNVSPG